LEHGSEQVGHSIPVIGSKIPCSRFEGISQEITAAERFFVLRATRKRPNTERAPVNFPDSRGNGKTVNELDRQLMLSRREWWWTRCTPSEAEAVRSTTFCKTNPILLFHPGLGPQDIFRIPLVADLFLESVFVVGLFGDGATLDGVRNSNETEPESNEALLNCAR
jgi:hypothetical protein